MKAIVYQLLAALAIGSAAALRTHAALEMVSTNSVDIGRIYSYAGTTNTFHFANTGTTDIAVLDALSTCPCIQAVKKPVILRPGDSYTLETRFSARTVHGPFTRGVWLVTDDPAQPRTLVKVTGEVLPLFEGVPEQEVVLTSPDASAIFTNDLFFTAATTDFALKEPLPNSMMQKHITASLTREGDRYHLRTIIRSARHLQNLFVKLPVEGPLPTDALQIRFKVAAGAQLRASPARLIVPALDDSLTKTLYINTQTPGYLPDELNWTPRIEGLTIKKELYSATPAPPPEGAAALTAPRRSGSTRYTCTLSISPAALREIMQRDEHAITFTFPDHTPVKVELVALDP